MPAVKMKRNPWHTPVTNPMPIFLYSGKFRRCQDSRYQHLTTQRSLAAREVESFKLYIVTTTKISREKTFLNFKENQAVPLRRRDLSYLWPPLIRSSSALSRHESSSPSMGPRTLPLSYQSTCWSMTDLRSCFSPEMTSTVRTTPRISALHNLRPIPSRPP
jgi:hypothetical protein